MGKFYMPALCMLLISSVAAPSLTEASCLPESEKQKIEALIRTVENLKDAVFIRNGKEYTARMAAEFLRRKWAARAAQVCSVEDFIDKVASFSSTTGRPYLVRFPDGREMKVAQFFHAYAGPSSER